MEFTLFVAWLTNVHNLRIQKFFHINFQAYSSMNMSNDNYINTPGLCLHLYQLKYTISGSWCKIFLPFEKIALQMITLENLARKSSVIYQWRSKIFHPTCMCKLLVSIKNIWCYTTVLRLSGEYKDIQKRQQLIETNC